MFMHMSVFPSHAIWSRKELKRHCLVFSLLERIIAQRSRVRYLKDGDANTSFFHKQASFRKRKNFIAKLVDGDQFITAQEEKQQLFFYYFSGLLGTAVPKNATLNLPAFHRIGTDVSFLDLPSLEDEVWATIKSLRSDRAPRPEGYTGQF